jgi:hypothetical protein
LIDVLPPGLYEAVMTPKTSDAASQELISGDWIVRFEPRKMSDIRAIVQPSAENERRFATVRHVSEMNVGLYRTFLQPFIKATVTEQSAEWMKKSSPSASITKSSPAQPVDALRWPIRSAPSAARRRRTTRS